MAKSTLLFAMSGAMYAAASTSNSGGRASSFAAFRNPTTTAAAFAFSPRRSSPPSTTTVLASTPAEAVEDTQDNHVPADASIDVTSPLLRARDRAVATASFLSETSPTGIFMTRRADQDRLREAVGKLETLAPLSATGASEKAAMVGDWTLVATANVPSEDARRRLFGDEKKKGKGKGKKLFPFGKRKTSSGSGGAAINPIQEGLRKSVEVTQRIRTDGNFDSSNSPDTNAINRVDNVIEFTPLDTLESIVPSDSPFSFLREWNVNPLGVSKSKVILAHKAEVESVKPVLRTRISQISTILNVAGTSQYLDLDPSGSDVLGLNVPLGEFLQSGSFDTTYVDDDVRISRSKNTPLIEQLRVFVRKGSDVMDSALMDALKADLKSGSHNDDEDGNFDSEDDVSISDRIDNIADAASEVRTTVKTLRTTVEKLSTDVVDTLEKDMESVERAVGVAINDVTLKVQDAVEDNLRDVVEAVESVESIADVPGAVSDAVEAVARVPGDVLQAVGEDVSQVSEAMEDAMDDAAKDVQDVVEDDLKEIGEAVKGVQNAVTGEGEDDDEDEAIDEGADDDALSPTD